MLGIADAIYQKTQSIRVGYAASLRETISKSATGTCLADRIGRRPLFLIFSAGAIVPVLCYTQLPIDNDVMLILGFPLNVFARGYISGVGPFLTELFPTALRGSGQGFCYNFRRGLGALFPAVVGYLSRAFSLATAMALFATLAYSLRTGTHSMVRKKNWWAGGTDRPIQTFIKAYRRTGGL